MLKNKQPSVKAVRQPKDRSQVLRDKGRHVQIGARVLKVYGLNHLSFIIDDQTNPWFRDAVDLYTRGG